MENKISLFLKGHPLRLASRLKYKGYNPVFSFDIDFPLKRKTVIITISLLELVPTINFLKTNLVEEVRIVAYGTKNEIDIFGESLVQVYKKADLDIIPAKINLNSIVLGSFLTNSMEDLDKYVKYIKQITPKSNGKRNKNAGYPKRKTK